MSELTAAIGPEMFSEAAIFGRITDDGLEITPALADSILKLKLSAKDQLRITCLLEKNSRGEQLTKSEQHELNNFNHIGDLLSLWHSRARLVLRAS